VSLPAFDPRFPNGDSRARSICGLFGWLLLAGCAGGDADAAMLDAAIERAPALDAAPSGLPASMVPDSGHRTPTEVGRSDAAASLDAGTQIDGGSADEDAGIADAAIEGGPHDAGPWVPVAPECVAGEWHLAGGFLPARPVDYIADRDMRGSTDSGMFVEPNSVPHVISSAGMPCANARDRAKCEADLVLPTPLARHLVSTEDDGVRVWQSDVRPLLGSLDTAAEALWWIMVAQGLQVPCDSSVVEVDGGFHVQGRLAIGCTLADGGYPAQTLLVRPTGELEFFDGGAPCDVR
jgi:hypothetical protein